MTRRVLALIALLVSLALPAAAQADVNPVVSGSNSGTGSTSFGLTIPGGTDRLLAVGISTTQAATIASVTYGAQVLTQEQSVAADGVRSEVWIIRAPNPGTANIVVTALAGAPVIAGATSFSGVDQALPIIAGSTGTENGASNSANFVTNNTVTKDGMFGTIALSPVSTTTEISNQGSVDTVVADTRWSLAEGTIRGAGSTRSGNTGQNMALNAGIVWRWSNPVGGLKPFALSWIALRASTGTTAPVVSMPTSSNVTINAATLGGTMTSTGGSTVTQRGVVYCTCATPVIGGAGVSQVNAGASDNPGAFSVNASGLAGATTYTYRAFATNAAGTSYTANAQFTTVTPNRAPTANAGGPYSFTEGNPLPLSGSGTDPDGDVLTYSWDVNGDGTYGDATGASPTLNSVQLDALNLDDGPASASVSVRVSDGALTTTSAAATLTITNAEPNGTATNSGPVNEGSTATVSFTGVSDPSAADTAAGFHYSYDFDNNGSYEIGGSTYATATTSATATVPATYLGDGPATRTVRMVIFDKNNGSREVTTTITVDNVAPTGALANQTVNEGQTATFGLTNVADPGDLATIRYVYDFDGNATDDTAATTYANASTASTANAPASATADGPSTRTVRVRVIDKDGDSNVYTATVTVRNVAPSATLTAPANVDEGAVANVSFAGVTDASPTDGAAGTKYAYDFDNDGTWDLGTLDYATASPLPAVSLPAALTADGPATLVVKAAVIDKDGGASTYTKTITVDNVAPTATLADVTTEEGTPATIAFTGADDVSAADKAAGFTFEWDVDGDGTFDPGTGSVVVPTTDGPSTRTIKGAILDRDGGRHEYSATLTVTNVAPTATITGPDAVPASGETTLTIRTADIGTDDLTAVLDWGDATTEPVTGAGEKTVTHTYTSPGAKVITLVATDSDGAKSAVARHELTVAQALAAPAPTATPTPTPAPAVTPLAAKQSITGVRVTPRCLRADDLRARISKTQTMKVRFTLGAAAPVKFSLQRLTGKGGASKCPPVRGRAHPDGKRVPGVYSPFTNKSVNVGKGANTVTVAATGRSGKRLTPGTYLLTVESGGVSSRTKLWVLAK